MIKQVISPAKLRQLPSQFSWVDQALVRDRHIDQLSHPACALYLFLITVADAQGLSYYADRSVCQRLSMSGTILAQARQHLIDHALIAYRCPLYQVLELGPPNRLAPATPPPHQEPVDVQAVFKRIWEILS